VGKMLIAANNNLHQCVFYGTISLLSSLVLIRFLSWTKGQEEVTPEEFEALRNDPTELSQIKENFDFRNIEFISPRDIQFEVMKIIGEPAFINSVSLVQKSWCKLKPNYLQPAIATMFRNLKCCDHMIASLFKENVSSNQKNIFCAMLGTLMSQCGNPDALSAMILKLGVSHSSLKVRPSYYDTMRNELVLSVKDILLKLGHWDSQTENAWHVFMKTISRGMILAGDGILMN